MQKVSPHYCQSAWSKNPTHLLEYIDRLGQIVDTNLQRCKEFKYNTIQKHLSSSRE